MKKITLLFLVFALSINLLKAQKIKFGKVPKDALLEKTYPLDSTESAAYLYKNRRTFFRLNEQRMAFDIVTEVHHRIKIYKKEGFDYASFNLAYYTPENNSANKEKIFGIKGYTFNIIDGKIKKDKLSSKNIFNEKKSRYTSAEKFSMPNLKKGCVIDVKYTHISPYNDIEDLDFQNHIPIKKLYMVVEIPEYYKFNIRQKGYYFLSPQISYKTGSVNWTNKYRSSTGNVTKTQYEQNSLDFTLEKTLYEATDIPAFNKSEPFVSNIENYKGGMKYEISSINFPNSPSELYNTSWEDVAKKIFKSSNFGTELEKSTYFKDDLEKILLTAKTDKEKTIAIFEFVKQKMNWNKYYGQFTDLGVKKAYNSGTGNIADINLILVAMLRKAGLFANPVLVSTKSNGIPIFPTTEGYNYVIAEVKTEENGYALLDASEKFSAPNLLPRRTLNWSGRIISKSGNSKAISLIPKKHTTKNQVLNVQLDSNLKTKGMLKTTLTGLNALEYRSKNNHLSEDSQISKIEKKYEIEVDKYRVTNKDKTLKPLSSLLTFENKDDLAEQINDKLYITPLLFLTTKKNPFKSENRNFPVDFTSPWSHTYKVSISIPEGFTIVSIPEKMGIGLPNNIGFFKYKTSQQGNNIFTQATLQFNEPIINPDNYKNLKDFFSQMVTKQAEKIVLVKK
jgi:hypothetical protein